MKQRLKKNGLWIFFVIITVSLTPSLNAQQSRSQGRPPVTAGLRVNASVVSHLELIITSAGSARLHGNNQGAPLTLDFGGVNAFGAVLEKPFLSVSFLEDKSGTVYSAPVRLVTRLTGVGQHSGLLSVKRSAAGGGASVPAHGVVVGSAGKNFLNESDFQTLHPNRQTVLRKGIGHGVTQEEVQLGLYVKAKDPLGPKETELIFELSMVE